MKNFKLSRRFSINKLMKYEKRTEHNGYIGDHSNLSHKQRPRELGVFACQSLDIF